MKGAHANMKEFKGFTHGINLGGWLSQCDYSKERMDNFIREEDFEIIASRGLDLFAYLLIIPWCRMKTATCWKMGSAASNVRSGCAGGTG